MSVCLLPHSEKKTESLKFLCRALNLLFSSALSRPSLSCLSDRLLFIHICGATIGSDDLFLALFWTSDTMQWRGIPNISAIQHIKNNLISARQKKEVVKCVILDARGILRHLENALHCGKKNVMQLLNMIPLIPSAKWRHVFLQFLSTEEPYPTSQPPVQLSDYLIGTQIKKQWEPITWLETISFF